MKLLEQGIDRFQRGAQGVAKGYVIEQNSKVMDIFSNMLYNDKIAAPIRELATNAWDAHVMAGSTDKVPVVTLPSSSKPEYSIRDFGTGLSKDEMENMYQTYGRSTKNHSNDFNGCMGIGSKSPFAYTRSFTTTSYKDGMKYVYINAKDEHNMPNLQLFFEGPTDEPNGLEVSFAVEKKDVSNFAAKAKDILQWFPNRFEVKGGESVYKWEWPKYTYKLQGDGWRIRGDGSNSVAIMGYIQYPIDAKHFSNDQDAAQDVHWYKHGDTTNYVQLLNLGLEMDFAIGEIEMSASREGLQYTPATVQHIKRKLDVVFKDIQDKVQEHLKAAVCLWDAKIVYRELLNGTLSSIKSLIRIAKPQWNGQDIEGIRDVYQHDIDTDGIMSRSMHKGASVAPKVETSYLQVNVSTNSKLYIADMPRGNDMVVKYLLANDRNSKVYLFRCPTQADIDKLVNKLGITKSHLNYTSQLPKPPKGERVKNEKVFVYQDAKTVYSSADRQHQYWVPGEIDFNKGGLYLELNNWYVSDPDDKHHNHGRADSIHSMLEILTTLGIKVPRIVAVKTAVVDRYNKAKQWTSFFKWAKAKIEKHIARIDVKQYMDTIATFKRHDDVEFYQKLGDLVVGQLENPTNSFGLYIDKLQDCKTIVDTWEDKLETLNGIAQRFGISMGNATTSSILDTMQKQVTTDYPFINLIDENRWSYQYDSQRKELATIVAATMNRFDKCSNTP